MKILVLQLARLGDIYQSWPTLKALKRSGAEVHLMTRQKFAQAAPGSEVIDRHWLLDTRDVLAPLVDEKPALEESIGKLDQFCELVRAECYDRIVNLSFSPFSSYLTKEIAWPSTEVRGYTRFDDGYLEIPDDGSAYFYGQVGVGKANRVHVTDLFAYVAGVTLTEGDWASRAHVKGDVAERSIVIHLGASDAAKTLSSSKWQQVVKGLCESTWKGQIILIGSPDEADIASFAAAVSCDRKPVNLVGRTTLEEVFEIVGEATLLIGGDSGPVQMATLTSTPVLNLSLPLVSHWETGPRSAGSRICLIENEGAISAEEIVREALSMTAGTPPRSLVVRVPGPMFPYVEARPLPRSFEWDLVRAVYMGESFPEPLSDLFMLAIERLRDVNELALEQIHALKTTPTNKIAAGILDRVDEIMDQIVKMVPEVVPLVSWFRVERTRIGPMPMDRLVHATEAVHRRLTDVLAIYSAGGGNDNVELGQ